MPVLVVDSGFVLKAGESRTVDIHGAGRYELEITSNDGLNIVAFVSRKDFALADADGAGAEYYAEYYKECSATKSTRFHQTCDLPAGAVLAMKNPNVLQAMNVQVTVREVR